MIEVREAPLPAQISPFMETWFAIHKDHEYWVPPLRFDMKKFLNPSKNPYFKVAEVQCFIAYEDGKPVGTIAATHDHALQEHEPGVGMFGFFEFFDDKEISAALWKAATGWLRSKGMTSARGPANFNTNHEFGLIIEGFDCLPMIANPWNPRYYVEHYEALGIPKAKDWYTYDMDRKGKPPEIIRKIADRFLSRHPEVEIKSMNKANFDQQVEEFWGLYNDAWEDNWGHIRFGREEFIARSQSLKHIMDERLAFIAYVDGKPAAASVTLPDYNQVAKKMNGSLFPFGWWHFVRSKSIITRMRVFVLGVKKEYQKMPLGAPLYLKTWDNAYEMGLLECEASLILEDNHRMRGALEKLGLHLGKKYRMFEAELPAE